MHFNHNKGSKPKFKPYMPIDLDKRTFTFSNQFTFVAQAYKPELRKQYS